MASTKTKPRPDLKRLRALAEEAAPHVERLTETLAVARHENAEVLRLVQEYLASLPGGLHPHDIAGLDRSAYLDADALRPACFLLLKCMRRIDSLHQLAIRSSLYPRQTLYIPNGHANGRH
ncbi:MAG TPA: hypothetical protein PLS90_16490 [Candidatus Sumerlaeota bacterium]|nr:hypothetical protein [Candidatus Sumerlaeota bacterium]